MGTTEEIGSTEAAPWMHAASLPAQQPSADHPWQGLGLDGIPALIIDKRRLTI
jgi:hypothetical protein